MERILCPVCNRETPATRWENRIYSGWHYFCVNCGHHWSPAQKDKLADIIKRVEVIERRLGIKGD